MNLLLLLLDGHRITLRMLDLAGPEEAPAPIRRLPALMDEKGHLVWQGSFDSRATELAWRAAGGRPIVAEPDMPFDAEAGRPLVNGMQ